MSERRYRLAIRDYEKVASRLGYGVSRTLSPVVHKLESHWFECTVDTDEAAAFVEELGGERIAEPSNLKGD